LLGKALLSGETLLSRRAARTLITELLGLALSTWAPLAALLGKPLLSGKTLLSGRAARTLFAELLGLALLSGATLPGAALAGAALARSTLSALLSLLELRATRALLAKLLWLALSTLTRTTLTRTTLTWTTLTGAALSRSTLSALLSLLELRTTRALLAKLLRLALLPTLLSALLSSLSSWTAWSLVGRLTALLGLSLTARLPAGLAFVLLLALVLVLGIFPLRDDQAAICSADAIKRDAQLRSRNRRHQSACEQDVAKLLQLPDRFEWQVALPENRERRIISMRSCRPECGTSSAPLRPDFGSRLNGFQ
jgi:hypothetical protein